MSEEDYLDDENSYPEMLQRIKEKYNNTRNKGIKADNKAKNNEAKVKELQELGREREVEIDRLDE